MTITNLTFSKDEAASIKAAALLSLKSQGLTDAQARKTIRSLSTPNLLRLSLGLPLKSRGGQRPGGFTPGHQHNKRKRKKTTPSN